MLKVIDSLHGMLGTLRAWVKRCQEIPFAPISHQGAAFSADSGPLRAIDLRPNRRALELLRSEGGAPVVCASSSGVTRMPVYQVKQSLLSIGT